ncbi:MAG TPA: hypothetical protein VGG64_20085 [Pirellulales bacterium]
MQEDQIKLLSNAASVAPEENELAQKLEPLLTQLRITIKVFAFSLLVLLSVALCARSPKIAPPTTELTSTVRWVAIFSAPLAFALSRALARSVVRRGRSQLVAGELSIPANAYDISALGDAGKMYDVYQRQAIRSATVVFGAALFCVAAVYLVGSVASLGLSIVLMFWLHGMYPHATRVAEWIDNELRLVDDERVIAARRW